MRGSLHLRVFLWKCRCCWRLAVTAFPSGGGALNRRPANCKAQNTWKAIKEFCSLNKKLQLHPHSPQLGYSVWQPASVLHTWKGIHLSHVLVFIEKDCISLRKIQSRILKTKQSPVAVPAETPSVPNQPSKGTFRGHKWCQHRYSLHRHYRPLPLMHLQGNEKTMVATA